MTPGRARIALLTPSFPPLVGGAERGVSALADGLAERHNVFVITPDVGQNVGTPAEPEGRVHVTRHATYARGPEDLNWGPPLAPRALRVNAAVARRLRALKPDVVLAFYLLPYAVTLLRASLAAPPVVLSLIGRDVDARSFTAVERRLARAVLARTSERIFISQSARRRLAGTLGRPVSGCVIPLSVRPDFDTGSAEDRARVRARWAMGERDVVLYAQQRLSPVKRFDVVIEAMARVACHRDDVHMVVGGTGPEQRRIEERVRDLGLGHRVRVLGYVEDDEVPANMAAADAFVFHSTFETLGLSVLEGMLAGLPIVCADATAAGEVVDDGETGLLAKPGEPDDIARAILTLAADPALRRRMGGRGGAVARRLYGADTVVRRYEEVLLESIRERRRA